MIDNHCIKNLNYQKNRLQMYIKLTYSHETKTATSGILVKTLHLSLCTDGLAALGDLC